MNRDLVIVRAGKHSSHGGWLDGNAPAGFDIIISAYEPLPDTLTALAVEMILIPGPKVASWRILFETRPELLTRYDQIALIDDDMVCNAADIRAAFEAGREHGLSLWQPSLTCDSYFSYAVFLHNPLFQLRYVNFVEMMCPFFSSVHLALALPLFSLGYELSIDRLWCRLRPDWHLAYAVLDNVQFRHSRPVGKNAEAQGFRRLPGRKSGNIYQPLLDQAEVEFGVVFRGPVAYAGITRAGTKIRGRWTMALWAFAPLRGFKRKMNARFYTPLADHIRHNLTRPVANEMLKMEGLIASARKREREREREREQTVEDQSGRATASTRPAG